MFGSSDEGFQALDDMGIVEIIAHETLHSNILSIRSTCLYIIGLFSRSATGEERLLQLGFMVTMHYNYVFSYCFFFLPRFQRKR